jgi:hypothetical protein
VSQRYFLTAESTYEDLRVSLNTQLQYPNALGKSVFQTSLQAPRDSFRRVLLAVDTDLAGYATIASAIQPLLDSDAMEELDQAAYLAAVASATAGVADWSQLTGKPTTLAGYGITDAAAASHNHSAADITSGTVATARLGSGTADATTFLRGDGAWSAPSASVTYATTAQAQDLTATAVAMNPANVRTAIRSFVRVPYTINFTANGGSGSAVRDVLSHQLNGGSSANGTAAAYHSSNSFSGRVRQGFDWSLPTAFNMVITRQTCPATGIMRALFGCLSNAFQWTSLDGRGFGFEIRQSRIWVIVHNGTTLSTVDSGIDTFTGDFAQEIIDVWIRSDGAGNVTLTRSLNGGAAVSFTTTGGPSVATSGTAASAWAGVNNGATASAAWFFFSPHLVSIQ